MNFTQKFLPVQAPKAKTFQLLCFGGGKSNRAPLFVLFLIRKRKSERVATVTESESESEQVWDRRRPAVCRNGHQSLALWALTKLDEALFQVSPSFFTTHFFFLSFLNLWFFDNFFFYLNFLRTHGVRLLVLCSLLSENSFLLELRRFFFFSSHILFLFYFYFLFYGRKVMVMLSWVFDFPLVL